MKEIWNFAATNFHIRSKSAKYT